VPTFPAPTSKLPEGSDAFQLTVIDPPVRLRTRSSSARNAGTDTVRGDTLPSLPTVTVTGTRAADSSPAPPGWSSPPGVAVGLGASGGGVGALGAEADGVAVPVGVADAVAAGGAVAVGSVLAVPSPPQAASPSTSAVVKIEVKSRAMSADELGNKRHELG
jgi:hypothetical protein